MPARKYSKALTNLEEASRHHGATKSETDAGNQARAEAIVEVSKLGVPRSAVAKLTGLTRGRVQQILDQAGEAGATGEDWDDPELRRLAEARIAARPIPSVGVGLRRESILGPHVGRGVGVMIPLTGDLANDRDIVIERIERLATEVRAKKWDHLLDLTGEEREVVDGKPVSDS